MPEIKRVLLTGATGFVGRNTYPVLADAGLSVVCGTREPERAMRRFPGRTFTQLDVLDYDSTV
jgi:nucleoside-diphosphate-sugar epimerase